MVMSNAQWYALRIMEVWGDRSFLAEDVKEILPEKQIKSGMLLRMFYEGFVDRTPVNYKYNGHYKRRMLYFFTDYLRYLKDREKAVDEFKGK